MNNSDHFTFYRISWFIVVALLGIGASLPFFTFTKFYFFDDTFSLFTGIFHLLEVGEPLLFIIVFAFSILLPVYKLYLLYRVINDHRIEALQRHRYIHLLLILGKWSMLDVFVVAMLIVTVKLGVIASVKAHVGLYIFSLGVLASMLLSHMVSHRYLIISAR